MKITGKIDEQGKLSMANRAAFIDWITQHPNKAVEIEIKVRRKQRSTLQNSYLWGVVYPIVCGGFRDMGHDVDEQDTHEFLKAKFNSKRIMNLDGVVEDLPTSTTKLTTSEMMDYIAKIQMWAAEFLGVVIPDPNSQMQIDVIEMQGDTINGTQVLVTNKG